MPLCHEGTLLFGFVAANIVLIIIVINLACLFIVHFPVMPLGVVCCM